MSDQQPPQNNALAVIDQYLTKKMSAIEAVLRKGDSGLSAARMVKIATMVIVQDRSNKLQMCNPITILNSLMVAATLGLDPTLGTGKFWLIPRRNKGVLECTPLVGYKGMVELAMRHPRVNAINPHLVFQGEEFEIDPTHPTKPIHHKLRFDLPQSEESLVGAYAMCWIKNSRQPIWEYLPKGTRGNRKERSIEARRASNAQDHGPWQSDYLAMARKTILRALIGGGTVPTREELSTAIMVEDVVETGQVSMDRLSNLGLVDVDTGAEDAGAPPGVKTVEHTEVPADRAKPPASSMEVAKSAWLQACQAHNLGPEDAQELVRRVGGDRFKTFRIKDAPTDDLMAAAEMLLERQEPQS